MTINPSNPEKGCKWHFAPQAGGREDGPNDAMMQNFRSKPYSALVREAVQNSLDAILNPSEPVVVEFEFSHISARNFQNFFDLKDHIDACLLYFSWQERAVELYSAMSECFAEDRRGSQIGYIRVSDYNTKGMDYDPNSSQSPFYAFARAAGVSSKIGQESGGSFGFGKSAYFQLSPIGTVFISSQTHNGKCAFEGVSWLCSHNFNGQKVSSVGYYDNNGGKPVTVFDNIPSRFQRTQPGTNFYILGFKEHEKYDAAEEMIEEVLRSFWFAVLKKHLIVKINETEITANNLEQLMRRHFPSEVDDSAKSSHLKPYPYYMAVRDANKTSKAKSFTEILPILGECTLYLIKSPVNKDKIIYMRRPLMLVYGKRTQTSYGVHGLFVCTNKNGDKILQSLENPAHDEWKSSNWRDGNRRIVAKGDEAMKEIQDFVQRCYASLFSDTRDTALEITDLNELLYVPEDLLDDEDKDQGIGNPSGNVKDEGMSITTDIQEKNHKQSEDNDTANVGSVKIIEAGSQSDPDDAVSIDDFDAKPAGIGGHRSKKSRTKGGKPTAGDNVQEIKITNPDGTHKVYLPIKFRVAVQNEDGKNYHILIIHSNYDVIEGELELITIGEQSDDAVEIVFSNNGDIHDNFLTGVVLEKDKRNTIKILFKDNMRHTLKLKAYENQ
ncbi:MAG: hypothetical protein NC102_10875 [Clostridium sp.]|nr:hypothetical protein [Clostridium sp.]